MGRRYQQQRDEESEVRFRIVEIHVVRKNQDGSSKKNIRFLLVDNRRETLEMVQMNIHDFVRNAILANKIENTAHDNLENVSPDFTGGIPTAAEKSCASTH